jgi:hypothetical protein
MKKTGSFLKKRPDRLTSYGKIAKELINKHLSQSQNEQCDPVDEFGLETLEKDGERQRLETELLRSRADRYKQDTRLRETYARRVFLFMVSYTLFMALVVLLAGLPSTARLLDFPIALDIAEIPLATLIGGAFASAVGLVAFVIKGLFPLDRQTEKEPEPLRVLLDRERTPGRG